MLAVTLIPGQQARIPVACLCERLQQIRSFSCRRYKARMFLVK